MVNDQFNPREANAAVRADKRLNIAMIVLAMLILSAVIALILIYALNGRTTVSLTAAVRSHLPHLEHFGPGWTLPPQITTTTTQTWPVRRVPILMYHLIRVASSTEPHMEEVMSVSPELFKQEMEWLKSSDYQAVTFDDFVAYASSIAPLPPKPIIISFDDSTESQFKEAYPVLKNLGIKATFFVITDYLGVKKNSMTWDQVRELDRNGMTIGSHTRTHPYVNRLKDMKKVWDEVVGSKQIIEKNLGHAITTFAYPWGGYDQYLEKLCRDAGYTSARGAQKGIASTTDNRYTLKAITVSGDLKRFEYLLEKL